MSSLVIELQRECYDSKISSSYLLRKAFLVAKKLKIKEFEEWINLELNGYGSKDIVPDYRKVNGEIKYHNPYNGWMPVIIDDSEMYDRLSVRKVAQSVTHLEELRSDGNLVMNYPKNVELALLKMLHFDFPVKLFIDNSQVAAIIEHVRNIILQWALSLEEDGILGENMSFSEEEKSVAASHKYNVNNFFGAVSHSQIQQDTNQSHQSILIEQFDLEKVKTLVSIIQANIANIVIDDDDKSEIDAELKTIDCQLNSPKPKSLIIKESLFSIRNILEGITGSLIASGLVYQISTILSK